MRISEHIDRHARKAGSRALHAAKRIPPHFAVSLAIFLTVIMFFLVLFGMERAQVRSQDFAQPVPCEELRFASNIGLCRQVLYDHFAALPVLERATICEERERYGVALCGLYDEARAEQLHGAQLREYGISVWEPQEIIVPNGTMRIRALQQILGVNMLCDGNLVQTRYVEQSGSLEFDPVDGSCTLIARTAEGSVTSAEFTVRSAHAVPTLGDT